MNRFWTICGLMFVLTIGYLRLRITQRRILERTSFATEFLDKFRTYMKSHGKDNDAYGWMILHSQRMQDELGAGGLTSIRPPFENYFLNNYAVILNMLPEMRRHSPEGVLSSPQHFWDYGEAVQDVLVRHIGLLQHHRSEFSRELRNPIVWFRAGFQAVLLSPLLFLRELGIAQIPDLNRMTQGAFASSITAIASVISLAAAVITILSGWRASADFVKGLLHR